MESDILSFDPSKHQPDLLKAWHSFTGSGVIEKGIVPPYIAESWVRSKEYKVNPYDFSPHSYLPQDKYEQRIAYNTQLIDLARPIMENIYGSLEQSRYIVALYDSDGYHLLRIGQRADLQRATHFKIREGLCFDEPHVGTCGFSLVKRLEKPLQITGCEHYSAMLHYVTGAYGPIFKPNTKKLIGVFGVAGAKTLPDPHTLAIVVAATTAMENLIELNQARQNLFVFAKSLQIAVDSLEGGVILIDKERRICEVNPVAIEVLGLEKEHIRGKDISRIQQFSELEGAITESLRLKNSNVLETDCRINNKTYLATIKSLRKSPQEDVQGAIVQLKNVSELREIFQKVAGDRPRYTIDNMVGSSEQMVEIKNLARISARSDGSVIIEGESGTGKEVIAEAIHNASARKNRPFEVINCAAIPHELLESTLFGHEKGSFTGASSTHIGKFELADGGTLFLDEISEMSPAMQAKMLRAIEERKIERVGGRRPFDVDVKIIAATNKNLYDLVRNKLFRSDLFYRLNVFLISLPPLRNRKEDIVEFVHTFLAEFAPFSQKAISEVSDAYFDILLSYDWPGNIRELRNAVQYSVARMDDNGELLPRHLKGFFPDRGDSISIQDSEVEQHKLNDITSQLIMKTLNSHKGNKAQTARDLGISRATVYRKLREVSKHM